MSSSIETSLVSTFRDYLHFLRTLIESANRGAADQVFAAAPALCNFLAGSPAGRSINSAAAMRDSDGSWCIDVFVQFNSEKHPAPTTGRRIDILLFAAMMLMACSSKRRRLFYFHVKNDPDRLRYYIRFGINGGTAGLRVYFTRISVVTATDTMRRFAADHHTYRRRELLAKAGAGNVARGELSREDAIRLAVAQYAKNYPDGLEGVAVTEYEDVLRALLMANDRFEDGWGQE